MRAELSVALAAPVERAFALLSEPSERPRWQASLWHVELLTPGETRVGTRWRERPLGLAWVELEIVAFERDRLWSERARTALGTFTVTLRFAPVGEATRLDVEADLALRGPARLLAPAASLVLPRALAHDLRRAERLLVA
ncbi:MAG: SRPBCC family protein [Sandaracinaceae bacterium]|nr:SRPBCC family protein [Sandaracinaceae bacterium]